MDVPTKATSSYANAPKATNYSGQKSIGFIRNRDIKLKESEQRREDKISKAMIEGICKKCREKVQWRFKFDKYKPLKSIANCQKCKQKCVTKAYRTTCDNCASKNNSCSSCCQILQESDAVDYVPPVDASIQDSESTAETVFQLTRKLKVSEIEKEACIIITGTGTNVNSSGANSVREDGNKAVLNVASDQPNGGLHESSASSPGDGINSHEKVEEEGTMGSDDDEDDENDEGSEEENVEDEAESDI